MNELNSLDTKTNKQILRIIATESKFCLIFTSGSGWFWVVTVVQSKNDESIFDCEHIVHTSFCQKTGNLAVTILGHFDSAAIIRQLA